MLNKNWPANWHEWMNHFLGENFFSGFDELMTHNTQQAKAHSGTSSVKVNICASENELLCIFQIPGLKLNDIDIEVYDRSLEVAGTVQIDQKGFKPIHLELYQGPVRRKVKLPFPARHDKIRASYQHGYLYVHLHRLAGSDDARRKINLEQSNADGSVHD